MTDEPGSTPRRSPQATAGGLGAGFAAQLFSTGAANLGDGILGTLAPLLALSLTASPFQISLLSAAVWLPWLLFGLTAGTVVDRSDRRWIQIWALLARAAILGIGSWLGVASGITVGWLVALVLLYGVTEVFADLGATALVPSLVRVDRLATANGRIIGVQQVTNAFLGAPLAGVLVVLGAGVGLGVPAGLAIVAALALLIGLRGDFRAQPRTGAESAGGAWGQVREGLVFLVRHPVMRPVVLTSSLLNFSTTAYFAVFVLWAVGPDSAIRLTESQYPLLMLGFAVGALAGSLVAARIRDRLGELLTINLSLVGGTVLMLVPVLWPGPGAVAVALGLAGLTNTVGNVVLQALRQRLVPAALLGRVSGAARTLGYGLMPLGALAGGATGERFGLPATFWAAVGLALASCLYLALNLRGSDIAAAESGFSS